VHDEPVEPQLQLPIEEQVLAVVGSQVAQVPAKGPQASMFRAVTQVFPLQHPCAQVMAHALHAPFMQVPASHVTHLDPPMPHSWAVVDATHWPLSVQQPEQLVASQTHMPALQRWPVAQVVMPLPQPQLPAMQRSVATGSHETHIELRLAHTRRLVGTLQTLPSQQFGAWHFDGLHSQCPLLQSCVGAHCGSLPHTQSPVGEHAFARLESQVTHLLPPTPQLSWLGIWHRPSIVQHP
jgi:hypothetical protein